MFNSKGLKVIFTIKLFQGGLFSALNAPGQHDLQKAVFSTQSIHLICSTVFENVHMYLSTSKLGDNTFGSVRPSICPFVCVQPPEPNVAEAPPA